MNDQMLNSHSRPWILASGLAHLSLIAFFMVGARLPPPTLSALPTEITFVAREEYGVATTKPTSARRLKSVKPQTSTETEIQPPPSETSDVSEAAPAREATKSALAPSNAATAEFTHYEVEVAARLNALKKYPDAARRMRQQGRVLVRFKLGRDGRVLEREVVEPSHHATLNDAALSLLNEIQNFRPFPNQVTEAALIFTVPIEYRL